MAKDGMEMVELGHEWAKGMESKAPICLDGMQNDGHYEMWKMTGRKKKYELQSPLTDWNLVYLDLVFVVDMHVASLQEIEISGLPLDSRVEEIVQ